jgi:hypothetical protein
MEQPLVILSGNSDASGFPSHLIMLDNLNYNVVLNAIEYLNVIDSGRLGRDVETLPLPGVRIPASAWPGGSCFIQLGCEQSRSSIGEGSGIGSYTTHSKASKSCVIFQCH